MVLLFNQRLKSIIEQTVLCWLGTCSKEFEPNVSPKEVFALFRDKIIIANIASPESEKNIRQTEKACVSFVDIFTQKGYKVKGEAQVIDEVHPLYLSMQTILAKKAGDRFPFKTIFSINIQSINTILAPSYQLYPETTEIVQIRSAMKSYGVLKFEKNKFDQV